MHLKLKFDRPDSTSGKRSLLVREVWKSRVNQTPMRCQRLAIVAILMCGPWCKAAEMGTGIAHSWHPNGY